MTRTSRAIFGIAMVIAPVAVLTPLLAQSPVLDDELRRIFQTNDYAARSFGPAVWFDDGDSYGVVERPDGGGPQQLAEYDAASGRRTVIADATLLTPAGAAAPLADRRIRLDARSEARFDFYQHQTGVAAEHPG